MIHCITRTGSLGYFITELRGLEKGKSPVVDDLLRCKEAHFRAWKAPFCYQEREGWKYPAVNSVLDPAAWVSHRVEWHGMTPAAHTWVEMAMGS